ncbi:MAG: bifunctional transaldolase/phosoglucose isomerase [Anaerolineae bacterium]|nr:bifunctional transaldolase/phosoglucose isomerase [Anaerolineae bacterium]
MLELKDYLKLGQSIWLDDIRREYLLTGEMSRLVKQGLRGLTSNPTIFDKAISSSSDYDGELRELAREGKSAPEIFEELMIDDLRNAADILRPVYDESSGTDGFVSLEVSPKLAYDSQTSLSEAQRLFKKVDRPNLMIKIPATPQGLPAIQGGLAAGVNINITLIFSIEMYKEVIEAHMAGLEQRLEAGHDIRSLASVASFFVSRVDTAVDPQLEAAGAKDLLGTIGIANSKLAYAIFKEAYSSPRWQRLADHGAQLQRPLWASTSTKNPAYPDTLYADALIGAHTVNTLPPATIAAVEDHGRLEPSIERDLDLAQDQINRLAGLGIDLDAVTQKLQDEGVSNFVKSFDLLMKSITRKAESFRAADLEFSAALGANQQPVDAALNELAEKRIIPRIWELDYTVWKPEPQEISNRLGWLQIAEAMQKEIPRLQALQDELRQQGYTHALLLGMGGSSLAPEVMRKTFGVRPGCLDLVALDSTDPAAVLDCAHRLDPAKTLYIVSSKSGGTVETISFFKYFYNLAAQRLGAAQAGEHFIAITDPGSGLAQIGHDFSFRAVFLNDPNIGGRYSALSHFGLVPAALIGVDLELLLQRAIGMADCCKKTAPRDNPGAHLGAIIAELARQGRDKLTFITSAEVCNFGDWVEQLIAESTGKDGKGILPVVGEAVGLPENYADDRAFVYLRLADEHDFDVPVLALEFAGHPVVRLDMKDLYDLGGQFFLWEFAIAVAGQRLGIQPFDQPNVEAAKVQARNMVEAYKQSGALPSLTPLLQEQGISIYGESTGKTLQEVASDFLGGAQPGSYIALQAYLPPSSACDASLLALRTELRQRTRLAVTTGYGPRFLHSTGQLHKGDAGHGLFIQITHQADEDTPIPDEAGKTDSSLSFGVLELAQALGDRQALLDNRRKVLRFHLNEDIQIGLTHLIQALK